MYDIQFSLLLSIPFVCIHQDLCIHSLTNGHLGRFRLLVIMWLWTSCTISWYMCAGVSLEHISGRESLADGACSFNVHDISTLFSEVIELTSAPSNWVAIAPRSHHRSLFSGFLIFASLVGRIWYLVVPLICILITNYCWGQFSFRVFHFFIFPL